MNSTKDEKRRESELSILFMANSSEIVVSDAGGTGVSTEEDDVDTTDRRIREALKKHQELRRASSGKESIDTELERWRKQLSDLTRLAKSGDAEDSQTDSEHDEESDIERAQLIKDKKCKTTGPFWAKAVTGLSRCMHRVSCRKESARRLPDESDLPVEPKTKAGLHKSIFHAQEMISQLERDRKNRLDAEISMFMMHTKIFRGLTPRYPRQRELETQLARDMGISLAWQEKFETDCAVHENLEKAFRSALRTRVDIERLNDPLPPAVVDDMNHHQPDVPSEDFYEAVEKNLALASENTVQNTRRLSLPEGSDDGDTVVTSSSPSSSPSSSVSSSTSVSFSLHNGTPCEGPPSPTSERPASVEGPGGMMPSKMVVDDFVGHLARCRIRSWEQLQHSEKQMKVAGKKTRKTFEALCRERDSIMREMETKV